MELIKLNHENPVSIDIGIKLSTDNAFINANTEAYSFEEIREKHIIPVFAKDNEPTISQVDFIETVYDAIADVYHQEHILIPNIRVSHPIKGRIPDARDKPASALNDWEKTVYYERMMLVIEIPSITNTIDGSTLSLTIGGVKAYNQDNLYNRKGTDEHFKIFIGFKNRVCTNLCVWTDGYVSSLKVKSLSDLKFAVYQMFNAYNPVNHFNKMKALTDYSLTDKQFAQLIGRCRLYNYLPADEKVSIPQMLYGDQQIGAMCKDYYKDKSFCRDSYGNINLWKLYNLFTGINKSTYIDQFLDRSVNAFHFTDQIKDALENSHSNWYIN